MKKAANKPKSARKEHWFSPDRPIESVRADALGRSAFAVRLARSIRAWDGRGSLVIGLEGEWGTGKTSVKNMVLEELRRSPSRCPDIMEFSPWQVSGTGTLVHTFFRELMLRLSMGQHRETGLLQQLSSYAKHLSFLGLVAKPIGGVVALVEPLAGGMVTAGGVAAEQSAKILQAGDQVSKAAQDMKAKSLADLKRDLMASLARLRPPILVVIDDIDRLTTEEILQVFQLVKANADFPNIVYLLLFERSIVERALDCISGGRGHEFLQKIVQVEFHVPYAHRQAIEKALFSKLDKLIECEPIKPLFDQRRWRDLYIDGIARYFQNLRHVYRFLASFEFHVAQFRNGLSFEVNPVDLIGLEVLRVFEPELYEQLPGSKRILTRGGGEVFSWRIEQPEVDATIGQLLSHVPPHRHTQVKTILGVLFPPISSTYAGRDGVSCYKQEWLRARRVCHADFFDIFFTLSVGQGNLSQAELDRLIALTNDRDRFVEECRALSVRGLLETALERLEAYKERIPVEHMPTLIRALCDLRDEFPEPSSELLAIGPDTYALKLVSFGLRREPDPCRRLSILKEAFNDARGVLLPLEVLGAEERAMGRSQPDQVQLVGGTGLDELKVICIEKIKAAFASNAFKHNRYLGAILLNWLLLGGKVEMKAWVTSHIHTAADALWLVKSIMPKSIISTGDEATVRHYVQLDYLKNFVDPERLQELTSSIKLAELQDLDRVALAEFRKAQKQGADHD